MKGIITMIGLFGLIAVLGFGCNRVTSTSDSNPSPKIDRAAILLQAKKEGLIMNEGETDQMKNSENLVEDPKKQTASDLAPYLRMDFSTWHAAALADVTGGQSYGLAHTQYKNGIFTLVSIMGGLPKPNEGYFYEGWLIQRGNPFRVISTGRVENVEDQFVNIYLSKEDLSSFEFYSLTLEPENGNASADGEHILEGGIR